MTSTTRSLQRSDLVIQFDMTAVDDTGLVLSDGLLPTQLLAHLFFSEGDGQLEKKTVSTGIPLITCASMPDNLVNDALT